MKKPDRFDFLYFDWDRNKVTYFMNDEEIPHVEGSLSELIAKLKYRTVLIGESTFESYNLSERARVHQLALDQGHRWYGTPNRLTYRWRDRFGWDKTDENDARVIRLIAEYPHNLDSIRGFKTEGESRGVGEGKKFYYNFLPYEDISPAPFIGVGEWTRLKEISAQSREEEISRRLEIRETQQEAMEFRRLSEKDKAIRYNPLKKDVLIALGIDPGISIASLDRGWKAEFPLLSMNSVVWAIYFAAKATSSRSEFDSMLGAHAHGAKSMLRSQFYHWGWAGNGHGPMIKGASLSDYRREARRLRGIIVKEDLMM